MLCWRGLVQERFIERGLSDFPDSGQALRSFVGGKQDIEEG